LTFGTDALLLAAYIDKKYTTAIELGTGTGIISMLLLTRQKVDHIIALEVQEEYANLTQSNARLNNLSDRLTVVHTDLREYNAKECELLFTNPPYMKNNSGKSNMSSKKNIARHEVNGTIDDFCIHGSRMLKFGGTFAVVYRQDRLSELMHAMHSASLEPKRLTFVHADFGSAPSMVLVEAKKGGKCGLKVTRPLIIYTSVEHKEYTDDYNFIMDNGKFHEDFSIK
jgi:tRNA1(Val) A37 N6-methylase TrmN6